MLENDGDESIIAAAGETEATAEKAAAAAVTATAEAAAERETSAGLTSGKRLMPDHHQQQIKIPANKIWMGHV